MRLVPVDNAGRSPEQVVADIRQQVWAEATTALNRGDSPVQQGVQEGDILPSPGAGKLRQVRVSDFLRETTTPYRTAPASSFLGLPTEDLEAVDEAVRDIDIRGEA